jgi:hypothetical protein
VGFAHDEDNNLIALLLVESVRHERTAAHTDRPDLVIPGWP